MERPDDVRSSGLCHGPDAVVRTGCESSFQGWKSRRRPESSFLAAAATEQVRVEGLLWSCAWSEEGGRP